MTRSKHIVFDVVGTCVSFDAYHAKIEQTIGAKLATQNMTAKAFGYAWMTASELEFTFLSISKRYKPYKEILKALFYRTLFLSGVQDARALISDDERDACIAGYSDLQLRPGAKECFETLREAGFTIWLLTTADLVRVQGYFEKGGVHVPAANFISCDGTGLAKPALESYRPAWDRFAQDDVKWFAAAHMWDVSAAKLVGFRGAYCTVYEKEPCLEIFNTEMDVMADGLLEMARDIVKASS